MTEAYSELCQASKIERFAKIASCQVFLHMLRHRCLTGF